MDDGRVCMFIGGMTYSRDNEQFKVREWVDIIELRMCPVSCTARQPPRDHKALKTDILSIWHAGNLTLQSLK